MSSKLPWAAVTAGLVMVVIQLILTLAHLAQTNRCWMRRMHLVHFPRVVWGFFWQEGPFQFNFRTDFRFDVVVEDNRKYAGGFG